MASPGLSVDPAPTVNEIDCGLAWIAPAPPPPAPAIAIEKFALDVRPQTSVIVSPKLEVPPPVGVPAITQFLSTGDVKLNPAGKLPDDTATVGPAPNGEVHEVVKVTACL